MWREVSSGLEFVFGGMLGFGVRRFVLRWCIWLICFSVFFGVGLGFRGLVVILLFG